jgi:hypothetical protein
MSDVNHFGIGRVRLGRRSVLGDAVSAVAGCRRAGSPRKRHYEWMRHKGGNRAAVVAGAMCTGQRSEPHHYP